MVTVNIFYEIIQHTLRRQSASSGSSAARDFNGYHQTDANSSDNAVPTIEAVTNANDHLAPTELRQRVCIKHTFGHLLFTNTSN